MPKDNIGDFAPILVSVIGHIIILGIIIFGISFDKDEQEANKVIKVKMVTPSQLKRKQKKRKSPALIETQKEVKRKKEEVLRKKQEKELKEKKLQEQKLKEKKIAEKKLKEQELKEKQEKEKELKEKKRKQEEERRRQELIAQEEAQEAEANKKPAVSRAQSRKMALLKKQYKTSIMQKVQRNWLQPANMKKDSFCKVMVFQLPSGDVENIEILSCNADDVFIRSVKQAILKASPLPLPKRDDIFDEKIEFTFKPEM
jgi:colicin import membrane protein